MKLFFSMLFLFSFYSTISLAKVKVAFFEIRTSDGVIVSIEPGGRLFHVAIQMGHQWLNASPFYGVHVVDDVKEIGQIHSIIEVDIEIPLEKYRSEFGKSFSVSDEWSNPRTTYCSKLVAQILGISPTWMKNGQGWGLSPDDLFKIIHQRKQSGVKTCQHLFK